MSKKTELDIKDFVLRQNKVPILDSNCKYLKAKEYAKFICLSYSTILRMLKAEKINGAVKHGGQWLIPVKV